MNSKITIYLKNLFYRDLFTLPVFNFAISQLRYTYFTLFNKKYISEYSDNKIEIKLFDYSKNAIYSHRIIRPMKRTQLPLDLARVLSWPNLNEKKLLIVGPRFEFDLLYLRGLGFNKKNIHSIDLFSYSPLIEINDAHDIKAPDDSFDLIILSWVLVYSLNQEKMLREIRSKISDKGKVIITGDYANINNLDNGDNDYVLNSDHIWNKWNNSDDKILTKLDGQNLDSVPSEITLLALEVHKSQGANSK